MSLPNFINDKFTCFDLPGYRCFSKLMKNKIRILSDHSCCPVLLNEYYCSVDITKQMETCM